MFSYGRHFHHLSKFFRHAQVGKQQFPVLGITRSFQGRSNPMSNKDGLKNDVVERVVSKYEIFPDEKTEIFDVEQERERYHEVCDESEQMARPKADLRGISPNRGVTGVIDLEELLEILKRENARDLFVIEVPKHFSYVDYLVFATGRSGRHLRAIMQFVRKVYKYKVSSLGVIPPLEGENSNQWMAMDLGNIALHVFEKSTREQYDLETLWCVGKEFDPLSIGKAHDTSDASAFLANLTPLS